MIAFVQPYFGESVELALKQGSFGIRRAEYDGSLNDYGKAQNSRGGNWKHFFGDDAFGVEVAQRLAQRRLPESVRVVDFGIRGLDLTYALLDGYDLVILVDACQRGSKPGTLCVLEPNLSVSSNEQAATQSPLTLTLSPSDGEREAREGNVSSVSNSLPTSAGAPNGPFAEFEIHGLVPFKALELARVMGGQFGEIRLVSCEPATFGDPDEGQMGLSALVENAVAEALDLIESLIDEFTRRSHA